ncbi:hypothetical protein [Sphingosinithalassobacter portus]|uniref:hypothetical protein n=1 Tax=Stakelama portus TaxID=2676234 RepID=UPI000D6DF5EC|nr:hypothetical protein [Sphingosinithalassobacter portus]
MDTLPELPEPRAPEPAPDFAALDAALNGAGTAIADLRQHVETIRRHFSIHHHVGSCPAAERA